MQLLFLGVLLISSPLLILPVHSAENQATPTVKPVEPSVSIPIISVKKGVLEEDLEIVPASLPKGWETCTKSRIKIAYINSLPLWQRFFLSPYRSLEALRYKRCAKALMPATQDFMEKTYPLPYVPIDPQSSLKPKASPPQKKTP